MNVDRRPFLWTAFQTLLAVPAFGQPVNHTISSPQFSPEFSDMPNGYVPPGVQRFGMAPFTSYLAEAHPRNRAVLTQAKLDGCNTHSTNVVTMTLTRTDILGGNPEPVTLASIPANAGCISVTVDINPSLSGSPAGFVVDDDNTHLIVRIELQSPDPSNSFAGVRLYWDQGGFDYNPVPHFNDVPDTHPFFKYIQAFKDTGTTGGCSAAPPLYCPDSFVTRGQMAVFVMRSLMGH